MTTTQQTWPTPVRLPGQTAAPEGPVDLSTMYVMHHGFRRDLAAFAAAAQATPATDSETWRLLRDRWGVFATILHHHHAGEDAGLWPFLMGRADAAGRETLAAMEAEHAEIDPILEACAAAFGRLAEVADEDTRAALAVRLTAARESLGRHLEHEETEALVLLQQVMTQQEWHDLDQEHFKKGLSPKDFATIVPWAAYGLPADVRAEVLAGAGKAFALLWRITHRSFERKEARAFRYVGPRP